MSSLMILSVRSTYALLSKCMYRWGMRCLLRMVLGCVLVPKAARYDVQFIWCAAEVGMGNAVWQWTQCNSWSGTAPKAPCQTQICQNYMHDQK
jgi:hypothetical protein